MIRKITCVLMIFAVLLSFSSCSTKSENYVRQLKDLSIVQGFGVDLDKGEFEVTMQIFNESNAEGFGQNLKGIITTTYSQTGETVAAAVSDSQRNYDKETFFGQNKIMIISEDVAKRELSNVLDYYVREIGCRPDIQIAVTKKDAKSIIKAKCAGTPIPAEKIQKTLKNGEYNGKSIDMELYSVLNDYKNPTSDIYLPVVKTFGKNDNNVTFDGIAVFKDDKLKGYLNNEQTRGLLFINSKINSGNILIESAKFGKVTFNISSSSTKKHVKINDEKVKLYVNINVNCVVSEMENGLSEKVSKADIKSLEELADEIVKKEVKSVLNICLKKYKSDVFDIGRMTSQKDYDFYKKNVKKWNNLLPETEYNVSVKCKVKRLDSENQNKILS